MSEAKKPIGRPRTKPTPIKMTATEQEIVKCFLSVRLTQAKQSLGKFRQEYARSAMVWYAPQLQHFKGEIAAIKRLLSTLEHPVCWIPVNSDSEDSE